MCSSSRNDKITYTVNPEFIGCSASLALLEEVSVYPKPGLVTPYDNGSHTDMDAALFRVSAKALQPYFIDCAKAGVEWAHISPDTPGAQRLAELRPLGKKAEETMFEATGGINTHKGAVFSLGVLSACAGHAVSCGERYLLPAIFKRCRSMTQGLVASDFAGILTPGRPTSAGERLYLQYGVTGIRGQAENGFPLVRRIALPALHEALETGVDPNTAAVNVLLQLMRQTEDTNVLHRAGQDGLDYVRQSAAHALKQGGMLTPEGISTVNSLCDSFRQRRISPGGSADLLAITIFLYDLSVASSGQAWKTFSQLKQRRTYSGTAIPFTTVCAG